MNNHGVFVPEPSEQEFRFHCDVCEAYGTIDGGQGQEWPPEVPWHCPWCGAYLPDLDATGPYSRKRTGPHQAEQILDLMARLHPDDLAWLKDHVEGLEWAVLRKPEPSTERRRD